MYIWCVSSITVDVITYVASNERIPNILRIFTANQLCKLLHRSGIRLKFALPISKSIENRFHGFFRPTQCFMVSSNFTSHHRKINAKLRYNRLIRLYKWRKWCGSVAGRRGSSIINELNGNKHERQRVCNSKITLAHYVIVLKPMCVYTLYSYPLIFPVCKL